MQEKDFLLLFFCEFESMGSTAPGMNDKSNDKVCLFDHPFVALYNGEAIRCCLDGRVKDVVIVQSHIIVPLFIRGRDIRSDKDFFIFHQRIGNSCRVDGLRNE